MTAYTLAARETVREIRESLSRQEPTLEVLQRELGRALIRIAWPDDSEGDYEGIELWARLAADLAGMIQQNVGGSRVELRGGASER